MSWVAVAIGGGALVGAGGSIIGARQAAKGVRDSDIFTQAGNVNADPVMSALTLESLLGLGSGDLTSAQAAQSPFSQLANEINASNVLDNQSKRRAIATLNAYEQLGLNPYTEIDSPTLDENGKPVASSALRRAARQYLVRGLRAVGRANTPEAFQQLLDENKSYQQRADAFRQYATPIMDQIQRNRLSAQAGLAETGATAGKDINSLADLYAPQIAQQFQDERERVLQAANAGRFNPGAALGRLGETQALTQRTSAIERALQLLGGRQQVITNSLSPAQTLASAVSGQRNNAALTLANIGSAQANAQAQMQRGANENLGSGTAAAFNNIGGALQLAALLNSQGPGRQMSIMPGAEQQPFAFSQHGDLGTS